MRTATFALTMTFGIVLNACEKPEDYGKEPRDDGPGRFSLRYNGKIKDGRYYLSAATWEASDTAGNAIVPQTLQVVGDYMWTVEHQGANKYRVTATGAVKFNLDNEYLTQLNCKGARDVVSFELTESNEVRGLTIIESTCPQGLKPGVTSQYSINVIDQHAFQFFSAETAEGVRGLLTVTFKK